MGDSVRDEGDSGEVRYDFPFSQIPEWVLFHPDLSDRAVRLYGVILRYGNSTGRRIPGRKRLAEQCHACSLDSLDRAKAELVAVGALDVQRRFTPGSSVANQDRTNIYFVHSQPPGSRTTAATDMFGSRTRAAGVAAPVRHNREVSTDRPREKLSTRCGECSNGWVLPIGTTVAVPCETCAA